MSIFTFYHIPGLPSWPMSLQAPCFGRESKARVATEKEKINEEVITIPFVNPNETPISDSKKKN